MSSGVGHVTVRHQKATSGCYQSLLMSSAEPGCIPSENRVDENEDEEEGKRGCCCSAEHQLDAGEVMIADFPAVFFHICNFYLCYETVQIQLYRYNCTDTKG